MVAVVIGILFIGLAMGLYDAFLIQATPGPVVLHTRRPVLVLRMTPRRSPTPRTLLNITFTICLTLFRLLLFGRLLLLLYTASGVGS